MSADNWGTCPKCQKPEVESSLYGKVSEEEYLKKRDIPKEYKQPRLREDYEIFINEDGVFVVEYRCFCDHCQFRHEFSHEVQLKIT